LERRILKKFSLPIIIDFYEYIVKNAASAVPSELKCETLYSCKATYLEDGCRREHVGEDVKCCM
jgi:hypothetical protein